MKILCFQKDLDDRDILFQMLDGDSTSFKLNDDDSLKPVNFFISLAGFKKAYNYIAKECNFSNKSDVYKNMSTVYKLQNRIIL